jgi:hypothetical protein
MRGTLHWWKDGSAILSIDEGLSPSMVDRIRQTMEGVDGRLMVFDFPIEVIEHDGPLLSARMGRDPSEDVTP